MKKIYEITAAEEVGDSDCSSVARVAATLTTGQVIDLICVFGKYISGKKGWEVKWLPSQFPEGENISLIGKERVMRLFTDTSINSNNTLGGGTPYEFRPY